MNYTALSKGVRDLRRPLALEAKPYSDPETQEGHNSAAFKRIQSLVQAADSSLFGAGISMADAVRLLANRLFNSVIPSKPDGFTFCPRRLALLPDGPGSDPELYVVSYEHGERLFKSGPSEQDLREWLVSWLTLLLLPGYYVGGWKNEGVFHLDVSFLVKGRAQALKVARMNKQVSIYHLASCQTIFVGDEVIQPQGPLEPLAPAVS